MAETKERGRSGLSTVPAGADTRPTVPTVAYKNTRMQAINQATRQIAYTEYRLSRRNKQSQQEEFMMVQHTYSNDIGCVVEETN
jgi:hypothetical protein